MVISGNIIDVVRRIVFKGRIYVKEGKIYDIQPSDNVNNVFILPGLIDAHVHIESSMLTPCRYAQNAVKHGVVAIVTDPHEIANVCGIEGIKFMIEDGKKAPFKFYFGVPSCVPATPFDNSGATISAEQTAQLLDTGDFKFLAEMMNFPGVINHDPEVIGKINAAIERTLPVDGHAPKLTGGDLVKYIQAGISTDHECSTMSEAIEKIKLGMKIIISNGSASKNYDTLAGLINRFPDQIMLCTDDFHPDNFTAEYLEQFIKTRKNKNIDFWNLMQALTINPIEHYKLDVGLLQTGDPADFIVVNNLQQFNILQTWINGNCVFDGTEYFSYVPDETPLDENHNKINNFSASTITEEQIKVSPVSDKMNIIKALDGKLLTEHTSVAPKVEDDNCVSDPGRDILKIVVLNRYAANANPAVGFIQGFGIKSGAFAGSIAHDSHNIIAIGVSDSDIIQAINEIIKYKGGLSVVSEDNILTLPLPIAGLMTDDKAENVAEKYTTLNKAVKALGSKLKSPFMTMAFMSLLVIPKLKISDQGLFDVAKFNFTPLFEKSKI